MAASASASPSPSKPHGLPIRFHNLSIPPQFNSSNQQLQDELVQTLSSYLLDLFLLGPPRRLVTRLFSTRPKGKKRFLVRDVDGVVHQGELVLILSPSLSTSSTLLRALSAPPDLPLSPSSKLDYGLISSTSPYLTSSLRSEILYLPSSDIHFPSLSLYATLNPSARSKVPSSLNRAEAAQKDLDHVADGMGMTHAWDTTIGISSGGQGLSGGEKKRASLMELVLANGSVLFLDSPFNGLDSFTAKSVLTYLKNWAIDGKKSLVVVSPQVSDTLLNLFDKILVLKEGGDQVYFGKVDHVEDYFHSIGLSPTLKKNDNEQVVEFILRAVAGDNGKGLEKTWKSSEDYKSLMAEIGVPYKDRYNWDTCAAPLISSVASSKSRFTSKNSRWTADFFAQVWLLTGRQFNILLGELSGYTTKTLVNLLLSGLVGSLFWQLPKTTEAAFTRGSLLLLSIMFNAYLSLAELGKAIEGRDIVKRQSDFGFFSASSLALARVIVDLPLIGVQVLFFGTITYFLSGLQLSLQHFIIYIIFVYATALNLSSLFRMFAALSPTYEEAIRFCGIALNILVIFAGYFIPTRSMPSGLRFIHSTLDPISRSYSAVLSNEFHNLNLTCSQSQIIPSGPTYTNSLYQTCLLPGSKPQSLFVDGSSYLVTAYGFKYDDIWWNLGVMLIQAMVFLVIGVVAQDYLHWPTELKKAGGPVWARTRRAKKRLRLSGKGGGDLEEANNERRPLLGNGVGRSDSREILEFHLGGQELKGSVLTWNNLSLWVDTKYDTRRLLDRVSGQLKPGRVCALLGVTGAGKSSLLNVLAGRSQGSIKGGILVNGLPPAKDFYKTTGYVQQFDLHDEKSTVRESLEFSALLRQDDSIPRSRKLAYVNLVLDLLDLTHLSDAIVGTFSAGLDACSRKLLSIAVEVVARPTILFLDEPTTGLEVKSANKVVRLLKRLAKNGLAVIVTIHQPSPENFDLFDDVLLLQTGGKQLYFGPRTSALTYFSLSSSLDTNPADALLNLAQAQGPEEGEDEQTSLAASWRTSEEFGATFATPSAHATSRGRSKNTTKRKAAGVGRQSIELIKRVSRNYWRDVSYSYTKLFTSSVVPLVIGLSFFRAAQKNSIVSFQNRMFSVFLLLFVPVVLMNVSIFKTVHLRSLWLAREKPSKIYGPAAFCSSLLVSEIPLSLVCATIYFVLWYFIVGFPLRIGTIAYAFILVQIFWVFQATWAIWIVSLSSSLGTISNLLPFFLVSLEAFNGSLMPYSQMPWYWVWMYWISPFQWYVRGMLGVLLHGQEVKCASEEVVSFLSPPGQSCGTYLEAYLSKNPGQVLNPASSGLCKFCQFSTGDEWLSVINIKFDDRWTSLGILIGYTAVNIGLVYFLIFFPPRLPSWIGRKIGRSGNGPTAEMVAATEWERERIEDIGQLEAQRDGFT